MTMNCAIAQTRPSVGWHQESSGRRGFSLAELVVVLAIVLVLLGVVLPASRTLWDRRKLSQAENTVQGLLMTARANALRAGGVETGLLFYINDRGEQHIVAIECSENSEPRWQDVFRTVEGRSRSLPPPMRVVPRYVVEDGGASERIFTAEELANNSFDHLSQTFDQAQRHRNFFSMVYSSKGELRVRRDVLIQDDDADHDGFGDLTGLQVGPGEPEDPTVTEYWLQNGTKEDIDPVAGAALDFLVIDPGASGGTVAVNFASVDGLLVYDDAVFNGFDLATDKRDFLLDSAQPFYVNRLTGAVVLGPVGEAKVP